MTRRPAVFDCNVFLQAMLSARGPARACWEKCVAGEVQLFVSSDIVSEIQRLPYHPELRRVQRFTVERVERFLADVLCHATMVDAPPPVFTSQRDPDDSVYVNLAVASGAMLVVSRDTDLLDLMNDANLEGRTLRLRYPTFQVLTPPQFLKTLPAE